MEPGEGSPSRKSLVGVLLEAAERSGVEFRISSNHTRVKGPAGTEQLVRLLFEYEADVIDVLNLNETAAGDHDKPYDPKARYLAAEELERCRQLRNRLAQPLARCRHGC
jgi:hypothetical protein